MAYIFKDSLTTWDKILKWGVLGELELGMFVLPKLYGN
jgi:hypothetical protein